MSVSYCLFSFVPSIVCFPLPVVLLFFISPCLSVCLPSVVLYVFEWFWLIVQYRVGADYDYNHNRLQLITLFGVIIIIIIIIITITSYFKLKIIIIISYNQLAYCFCDKLTCFVLSPVCIRREKSTCICITGKMFRPERCQLNNELFEHQNHNHI